MAKYLDPKADLTFKKVFGEHKNLIISFLNALLPLDEGKKIETIEYMTPEMVPQTPTRKDTSVDVRCEETGGRKFIVEMQMSWTASFRQRVLLNASKAYVKQLPKGDEYHLLQPVYSLNLVNKTFEPEMDEYYHYYRLVHYLHSDKVLEGLHLVFVELPKFQAKNLTEKKMQVLWLRFLTEIGETTKEAPQDLLDNPQVNEALEIVEESAYNEAELYEYEKFWDNVSSRKTIIAAICSNINGIGSGRSQFCKIVIVISNFNDCTLTLCKTSLTILKREKVSIAEPCNSCCIRAKFRNCQILRSWASHQRGKVNGSCNIRNFVWNFAVSDHIRLILG